MRQPTSQPTYTPPAPDRLGGRYEKTRDGLRPVAGPAAASSPPARPGSPATTRSPQKSIKISEKGGAPGGTGGEPGSPA
ncbi:hypothetical protein SAMN05421742_11168 [Roseospirillum parvum]|uniref:Uncharacterized protein n=1 Tax=Roseospirillum parvum TaxID=83401 RepID=A0A1G8EWZ5_9PROT|nr:hypothetical protein SAMN05421742_11168 [Roseospirillum parvum]